MTVVATVEAPTDALPLAGLLSSIPSARLDLEPAVPLRSNAVQYAWLSGSTDEAIDRELREAPAVESFSVVETGTERTLLRVTWNGGGTEFFERVVDAGGVVVEATGTADGWTLRLRFESRDAFSAFVRESDRQGVSLDVRRIRPFGRSEDEEPGAELTDAQREAVHLALEAGYFAVPREHTLQELAEELGVSDTALSQRLRRAISTLLARSRAV
jgi:predicted DNA binding protein